MGEVNGIGALEFGSHGVLLGKHQAHNLTELDVVDEKLDVHRVLRKLGRAIRLIFYEVVFGNHLDVRIFGVDPNRSAKSNSN
jgi:hypothetical protein